MDTREKTLSSAHTIVVKVGSAVLTTADGLRLSVLYNLVEQLARLARQGRRICLVSSGAVAAGRTALPGRGHAAEGLSAKQALAAIGQGCLMREYEHAFAAQGLLCAQVLLTRDDLRSRTRFLNARNTFMNLLGWGVVPIVNENDTVAVHDLKFGDNDQLASLLLNLVEGDLYINLTSADGVLAVNPESVAPGDAVPCLECIDDIAELDIDSLCGAKTSVGTGGMRSKLMAARRAAQLGVPTLILPGRRADVLDAVFAGENLGTWVRPAEQAVSRRKYWMAYQSEPQGSIFVDEGAARALEEKGGSLLPGGIRAVEGSFEPGALVRVMCGEHHIGVGLTNYSSEDLERIKGLRRLEVAAILGNAHYPEVIHRDNLLLNAAV
ncbi:glutamate 5-kinase [Mailhella massiliensis]|uniref:Glutamate 5-kinase n=1 Tax=Mailhella massiliensis TaxID=1903261 RepID=A0A921AWK4_9BACT|nr:glutamate 5-kinase [Mailhella massiliensis]HJD97650.1 glutamate 5-kinase [Mailhella massiliensis]